MHLKYRTVIYVWACLLLCGRSWAQEQHHYVYIQSEKGQPFYVKCNGKVLSSTERGYIILPQVDNGTTPIKVGFPKNEFPEQQFYLKIAMKDQGFLLKKAGESSYTLYNLQTFQQIKADGGAPVVAAAEPEVVADTQQAAPAADTSKKEMMTNLQKDLETTFANKATVTGPGKPAAKAGNSFSSALDKVVVTGDDRDVPVEEAKPAPVPAETPVATETEAKKPHGKKHKGEKAPLTEEEQAILSDVLAEENKTAASEAATAEAAKEVPVEAAVKKEKKNKAKAGDPDFIEFQDDKSQPAATTTTTEAAVVAPPVIADAPPIVAEEAPVRPKKKKRKLFDDTEHPANIITDSSGYGIAAPTADEPVKSRKKKKNSEESINVDAAGAPVGTDAAVVTEEAATKKKNVADSRLINTDCGNMMDEATFRKVLRKFVAAKSDDGMIDVFRRQTRNYCLETAQVRTLAQLLTADDARYRLLDLSYSKTYDTEKYGSLESLLNDSYYKGRFKAMLHK
ncbi:uncharacterized protein DUF4476 [Chitinophaga niastensis]|uniref:Uncharacterized protein DUF4476 n=1 Tax=Chitinophaga niastensis TaxID=536980 RepID=A0A2P8HR34_CHINA|nr:DUF4476 domain-containing protein [Chitinophaga niastensis]PSL48679.1 uncharacterized protein DUF4476 [Chitinophaga niastensis]